MKKYHIVTFGCQSNLADSERIAGLLDDFGFEYEHDKKNTDVLIFNTCSVRQKAEDRILGLNKEIAKLKSKNKKLKVILTGCMMHHDTKKLKKRIPFFDFFVDIKNITKIPKLLGSKKKIKTPKDYLSLRPKYDSQITASVPISYGCDNFCTYCIVPYSRNREYSRSTKNIINEVKILISKGYKEIWLLGQNVNSYQFIDKNLPAKASASADNVIKFPDLLRTINSIPGDFWIRFSSPHPKDFSDDLIKAMKECKKVPPYLNLPAQSGDNTILKKMNRPYTISHYKKLIRKIKKAVPNISISTDLIVGFPGETKKQFGNTKKFVKEIGFDMIFISEYSPRPGTASAKTMINDIPHKEKEERKEKINKILIKSATKHNKLSLNKTIKVLITDKKNKAYFGRTEGNKPIEIKEHKNLEIGKFVNVKVTNTTAWNMRGKFHSLSLPKIIAVVGPTASGKSDLAVEIAKKFDGEIISADSRQVYKGMDIGSGKITKKEMKGIPHYLLDVADPKEIYNVADFKKMAENAIEYIIFKDKLPILCGGTNFYVQAVVDQLDLPKVKPNKKLRKELEKKTVGEMFKMLKKLDPERADSIDPKNPRRLVRAIEIVTELGMVPLLNSDKNKYNVLQIGITLPQKTLDQKIYRRLYSRMKEGMLAEVKRLKKKGVSWKRLYDFGLEYKYLSLHLRGKLTKEEMLEQLYTAITQFSKRQMTWLKRDKRINWVNKSPAGTKKTFMLTKNFLEN